TAPPVVADGVTVSDYADPLPQALILTAIVISFAVTSFFLVLAYRAYQELGTDNMELLRGTEDYE
ncbi:NADH-quinone oxidoreductase subunit K, partial [Planococcus sp. A6]